MKIFASFSPSTKTNMAKLLYTTCIVLIAFVLPAQELNRSYLTVMVIPYTSKNEDVLAKFENDVAYRTAIAEINNALLNKGYSNTQELRENQELIERVRGATEKGTQRDQLKKLIEELPADIVIEAELIWTDPPGRSQDREVQILLKAKDKHTSSLYATSTRIRSSPREYRDLSEAAESALTRDGKKEFEDFLSLMEQSLKRGRQLPFRFDLATASPVDYQYYIEGKMIKDWIKQALQQNALNGFYRITGESSTYLQGFSQEPVIGKNGYYVQPCATICSGVIQTLRERKLDMTSNLVGQQALFKLQGILK